MADQHKHPASEPTDVILGSMDRMFEQLIERLDGLTKDEYLWEPVAGMWSVRPTLDGSPGVDGAGQRDVDPPPVTTIAWRLWHIAIDCFDDYTRRFKVDTADAPAEWTTDAGEAIDVLKGKWTGFRGVVASRSSQDLLGESWGPWSEHSTVDMAMHASNELVHHAAEIGLMRDLYRAENQVDRLVTVVLTVADLDESVRLFTEGFGLDLHLDNHEGDEPWTSGRHAATSWTEGAFIHFALYETKDGTTSRGAQVAFAVDDLDVAHRRAVAAGAEVLHEARPQPWGRSARYSDPDGHVIELTQRG